MKSISPIELGNQPARNRSRRQNWKIYRREMNLAGITADHALTIAGSQLVWCWTWPTRPTDMVRPSSTKFWNDFSDGLPPLTASNIHFAQHCLTLRVGKTRQTRRLLWRTRCYTAFDFDFLRIPDCRVCIDDISARKIRGNRRATCGERQSCIIW